MTKETDEQIVNKALARLNNDSTVLKMFFKTFFDSKSGDYNRDFPAFKKFWKESDIEFKKKFVRKFIKLQDKDALSAIIMETKNPFKIWKKVKQYGKEKKQDAKL